MASGALPPGFAPVRVGTDWFWDGGLVSNTPLQYLLEQEERDGLVLQVDLFPARGPLPRDMEEVLSREKDIRYSSRTRLNTDAYTRLRRWQLRLKRALAKMPEERLDDEERALCRRLQRLPRLLVRTVTTGAARATSRAHSQPYSSANLASFARTQWFPGLSHGGDAAPPPSMTRRRCARRWRNWWTGGF